MGVYIKGMEMPKNCIECRFRQYEYCDLQRQDVYAVNIMDYALSLERHPNCPLVEIQPHGQLVDADAPTVELMDSDLDHLQRDDWREVIQIVTDAPTVNPEPHWIPVEQELPEEETDVLVTVHFLGLKQTHPNGWNDHIKESYYVEVASHICGEWSSASDDYKIARDRHKVIAWMPLPEPFKGVTS